MPVSTVGHVASRSTCRLGRLRCKTFQDFPGERSGRVRRGEREAVDMRFEYAARLRDEVKELRRELRDMRR